MHHDNFIFVGCDYSSRAGVSREPPLCLSYIQKNTVYAFFCRGSGIEVVGKYFMQLSCSVVYNDLFALKMSVSERRRYIDYCTRPELVYSVYLQEMLQFCQRKCKKGGVSRADKQRLIAVFIPSGLERNNYKFTLCQPIEGFFAQLLKLITVDIFEPRLIARKIVANPHGVGISAAHIVLGIVYCGAVFAPDHMGFFYKFVSDLIFHLNLICMQIPENQFIENLFILRNYYRRAVIEQVF